MTPCIKSLLTKGSENGSFHNSILILAAFFKGSGISLEQCLNTLNSYNAWSEYHDQKHIIKVVKSVYRSIKKIGLGCYGYSDTASIMKKYCSSKCHFSSEWKDFKFT